MPSIEPCHAEGGGRRNEAHLSLRNLNFLRPQNLVSAILLAYRTHCLFAKDVPPPSSHVGAEVRPPGNVVHLKTARKLARPVAKMSKKITWANPIATSSPEPLWCHQLEDGVSTRDVINVNPGTCSTYGLFQRKKIQHGFFRTFTFLVFHECLVLN